LDPTMVAVALLALTTISQGIAYLGDRRSHRRLIRQVDELEERVRQLERGHSAST
jgi:hypothetical protein